MIVPFDSTEHGRFVYSSFCLQTGEPEGVLHDYLRAGARVVLAVGPKVPGERQSFYGWAAAFDGALVHIFVKEGLVKFPLDEQLLGALALSTTPLRVLVPSRSAHACARAHGWTLELVRKEIPAHG